jgi:hypothetical protein
MCAARLVSAYTRKHLKRLPQQRTVRLLYLGPSQTSYALQCRSRMWNSTAAILEAANTTVLNSKGETVAKIRRKGFRARHVEPRCQLLAFCFNLRVLFCSIIVLSALTSIIFSISCVLDGCINAAAVHQAALQMHTSSIEATAVSQATTP